MSRFFNILREASRSQQTTDEKPTDMDWRALEPLGSDPPVGAIAAEIPDILEIPDTVASVRPVTAKHRFELAEELFPPLTPASNGSLGAATRVSIDPQSRLLPHALNTVIVEQYRRLRTKMLQQHATKPYRTVLVASPSPQDGKTLTVLNTGLSFAMLPQYKVLVIDGDLRKGGLGKWLGINQLSGLSNLLEGTARLDEVVRRCDELPIHFMARGTSEKQPAELLHSSKLSSHLRRLAEHFDLVLVDSSPVNLVTDAHVMAECCDAVLLVARAFSTTSKDFEKTARDLLSHRIIGTVLNGASNAQVYRRYSENYY
jgi:protein-tyrosine kinase